MCHVNRNPPATNINRNPPVPLSQQDRVGGNQPAQGCNPYNNFRDVLDGGAKPNALAQGGCGKKKKKGGGFLKKLLGGVSKICGGKDGIANILKSFLGGCQSLLGNGSEVR
jgi:hypothetical protein